MLTYDLMKKNLIEAFGRVFFYYFEITRSRPRCRPRPRIERSLLRNN